MLKFSTKAGTSVQRMKALACSDQELIDSIEELSAASEALFECQADGAELTQVLDNLSLAMEAINQGGLTTELLGTFNSEGELSACCGLENLTVAGLEAMSDRQVEKLEDKYVAGLEGKIAEYWAKFIAWLKNVWVKVKHWFTKIWQNRAKLFKSLEGVKMMKEFNGDAKCTVYSNEQFNKLYDIQDEIVKGLDKFKSDYTSGADRVSTFDGTITEFRNKIDEVLKTEPKEESLTQRGWNLLKLQSGAADFKNVSGPNGQMASFTTWVNGALDLLIKKAEAGAKETNENKAAAIKEAVSKQRTALSSALAAIRLENSIVLKRFTILHKVMKAAQTAKAAAK